jgi:hypothetical protein
MCRYPQTASKPKEIMKLALLPLLYLAAISAQADVTDRAVTVTTLAMMNSSFLCISSTGHCNYLITETLCNEKILPSGQKQKFCNITRSVDFTLANGEKKLVSNLPQDFQYCMNPDIKPTVATCMNSYIPH